MLRGGTDPCCRAPLLLAACSLYGLDIGDVGAAHLALALRVSPSHRVDSLNLCRNSISDHGKNQTARTGDSNP